MIRARIEEDLHRRFITALPGHGGLTWFIRECMQQFVDAAEKNPQVAALVQQSVNRTIYQ